MRRSIQALLIAAAVTAASGRAPAQERPPAPVRVAEVVEEARTPRRSFVGTVNPLREATVGSEVAGKVAEFLVREGDRVAEGAPLARLRSKRLEIDIEAAKADVELRQQQLAELENGSRKEDIEGAEALLAEREAERDHSSWQKETADRLRGTNTISEDEHREAVLELRAAELRVRVAETVLARLRAGPRTEQIAQARASVHQQEAVLRRLQDDLERHRIVAPFAGYVVVEHTEVGEWVSQGDPVATIVKLDQVDVRIGLLEDYVDGLILGTPAEVTIGALPGRTFEGKVAVIVPRADPRARTFPVDVRVPNQPLGSDAGGAGGGMLLKAGLFARVTLSVGKKQKVVLVPKDALVLGGPTPTVYVFAPADEGATSGTVRPVAVIVRAAYDGLVQVEGQVGPGERVVTQGNERLRPGQAVSILPPEEPR